MKSQFLNKKPLRLWEWLEYKKGSLIENGIALNETGTFIWKLCDGKTTVNEIISALTDKYKINKRTAERDVLVLIKLLIRENSLGW